jgi:hypothetical protein
MSAGSAIAKTGKHREAGKNTELAGKEQGADQGMGAM